MADFAKNVYVPMFYAFEPGLGMVAAKLLSSLTSWLEIPVNVIFGYLSDKLAKKLECWLHTCCVAPTYSSIPLSAV